MGWVDSGDDEPARPAHNQSVLKAVALLRCFVDRPDGQTLTELAQRTGINVSTTHRMLQTLTLGGILYRAEGSERYLPGPVLLALAGATFSAAGFEPALGLLRDLAERTGESASLGIRDQECAVVLLGVDSPLPLRFGHAAGDRVPLHALALGKALLAATGTPPAEAVVDLGPLRPMTPRTIRSRRALSAEVATVAERGYAVATDEEHLGVRSVAVIVGKGPDNPRAALSLQGPTARIPDSRIGNLVAALHETAGLLARLPVVDQLALLR